MSGLFYERQVSMAQPKLVIFDCDGVLVDSEPLTDAVMQKSFAHYGLDLPITQINSLFVGGTMTGAMHQARALGAALPDHWLKEIYTEIYSVLEQSVELVPGVIGVLDELDRAGIGYAIGSNGRTRKMEITLGRTGLLERFQGRFFSAQDCPAPKPAPDVYLKAAAHAGIDPVDCVVIEDSATGAKAGQAAGMRCFGYSAETPRDTLHPYCDAVFDDMAELHALLGLRT
jgi:HAD superfamily hydrolase (TIGR01509 family)